MSERIEIAGALLGALGIGLMTKRHLAAWPVSLAATLLYGWIFLQARLYADLALQLVFCLSIVYGWRLWWRDRRRNGASLPPERSLPPRRLSLRAASAGIGVTIPIAFLWSFLLRRWSDDPIPSLDAALSSACLLAQYWTARRHRESWLLWAGIDVFYTGVFLERALYPTALLYAALVPFALYGYRAWRR